MQCNTQYMYTCAVISVSTKLLCNVQTFSYRCTCICIYSMLYTHVTITLTSLEEGKTNVFSLVLIAEEMASIMAANSESFSDDK